VVEVAPRPSLHEGGDRFRTSSRSDEHSPRPRRAEARAGRRPSRTFPASLAHF
jgi:hypothetical protein